MPMWLHMALGIALVCTAGDSYGYPGEERFLSSKALKEYREGNFEEAERLYNEAAERAPEEPALQFNRGSAKLKADKLGKAIEDYKSVFDPENPSLNAAARYNSGYAHHMLARKALEAVGQQDMPGAEDAARQTAIEELETALEDYRAAIVAAPYDHAPKFNYELALRELEDLKKEQEKQSQEQQQQDQQQDGEGEQEDQQQQQGQDKQESQQQQEQNGGQQPDQQEQQEQQQQQFQPGQQDQNGQEQQQDQTDADAGEDQQEQQPQDQSGQQQPGPQGKPTPTPAAQPEQPQEQDGQQQPQGTGVGAGDQELREAPIGEMSQEEVERLLNSLPEENRNALQMLLQGEMPERGPMENDW